MASHPQGLPRNRRLKLPSEFSRVRAEGHRLVVGCLILNWKEGARCRLGVITSRKIGGAVVRNRARRLLRECFRKHQAELSRVVEVVLVARKSIAECALADVERDYLKAMTRAGLIQGTK